MVGCGETKERVNAGRTEYDEASVKIKLLEDFRQVTRCFFLKRLCLLFLVHGGGGGYGTGRGRGGSLAADVVNSLPRSPPCHPQRCLPIPSSESPDVHSSTRSFSCSVKLITAERRLLLRSYGEPMLKFPTDEQFRVFTPWLNWGWVADQ